MLCDVFFEHKTIHDSLLEQVLRQPNLLIPYRKDDGNSIFSSASINYGEARIHLYNDTFFKYKLFNSKKKLNSIPLKMYEDLFKVKIDRGVLWSKINGSVVLNDFIPKFYITNYELENLQIRANIHYLQDVVAYPDLIIDNMVKDKIVVIADLFENDEFSTIVGKMPGALIMLNVYFSLVNMENKISLIFMVYLFLILWFVSYLVFYPQEKLEEILTKMPFVGRIILAATYLIFMSVISYITYFLFSVKISLFYVSFLLFFENLFLHHKYYKTKVFNKVKHMIHKDVD